ncbi:MAG: sulfatase-like hydrolase/transferase [Sulfuritalea sp.]|nr:sulfatase-like hydrolase/transferase [Sulfuritalea sp.]MDP1984333.1 sulfatase-like hydrolase/transferase [Sulfuritalea sp.]
MTDSTPSIPAEKARPWSSWRVLLSYAIPLLVLSWARPAGIDEVIVMLTGVFIGLTHWFLSPLTTSLFLLGFGQIISLANAEKMRDTGDAILWQDLLYALPNFSGNLGTLWQYVGFSGLLAGVLGTSFLLLSRIVEQRWQKRSRPIGIAFSAAALLFYLPATHDYLVDVAADMQLFRQSAKSFAGNLHTHSLARFLHSTTLEPAAFQLPAGNATPFTDMAANLYVNTPAVRADPAPDIFVILNESQFNPSELADCHAQDDCGMSLYEQDRSSALRGPLKVHTHGWGTWNAEFTLMTGVPYFWFGESGFYSAYTTAPRVQMALAKHLASLGYRTIGIYPTQKGMLNAALAYRRYGFQEFHGAEDLDMSWDWCKIPDRLMYQKLMEKYRSARKEDKRPIFMVMLTVFNHGPHGQGCMDSQLAKSLGNNATSQAAKFKDYLHRSKAANDAATAFRDVALALPQHVLLLFAGDHQPSFEGLASRYPRRMHRQMPTADALMFTSYQFYLNYDGAASVVSAGNLRELDISFLASTLLELAMLPLGPLFHPNIQLRELCQGRLDSCSTAIIDSYKSHLAQVGFYK